MLFLRVLAEGYGVGVSRFGCEKGRWRLGVFEAEFGRLWVFWILGSLQISAQASAFSAASICAGAQVCLKICWHMLAAMLRYA